MKRNYVAVQEADFVVQEEIERLRQIAGDVGAIVTFTGLVREFHRDSDSVQGVEELFLEHYPGMTEKRMEEITAQAMERWQLLGCCAIHRVGSLQPGDQIVLVLTASSHRQAAFSAAEFIMDYLKSKAPFWKRQRDGTTTEWITQRESDHDALERWLP